MKIQDLMTTQVRTCGPNDALSVAAQAMWEGDCGCVPVIDGERRVLGMITDRDVCMAAHLRGAPLWALTVADAMAKVVYGCKPGDKPAAAAELMAEHQLRRLPVVDDAGKLAGLLTLGALAQAVCGKRKKKAPLAPKDLVELVATITSPRVHEVPTRSVIEVFREPAAAEPAAADKATLKPKPRLAKKAESTPVGVKTKKARATR